MPIGSTKESPLFTFKLQHSADGKSRKIWGVASTEAQDREKEVIAETAIQKALENFMALPIIHWYHSERPIGWITKARYGDVVLQDGRKTRGLEVEGEIKNTPDTDDVWNGILKGQIDEWSIFGTRRSGSLECNIPPHMRTSPCITKAMYLWSISLCPRGAGQNRTTFVEIVKAMSSGGSALIHPTMDEVRSIKKMAPKPPIDPGAPASGDDQVDAPKGPEELLNEILASLNEIKEHLGVGGEDEPTEGEGEEELPPIPVPTSNEEKEDEIQKGDEPLEGEDLPQDEVKKCTDQVKKAGDPEPVDPTIVKAQADRIAELQAEVDALKRKTPQGKTIVVDPTIVKGGKPSKNGTPNTPDSPGQMARFNRLNKILQR
jgi:Caudovirus prohead protease.